MQCGVLPPNIQRPAPPKLTGTPTPVHDLNVPYEGHEEYETPTAEMLFPPVLSLSIIFFLFSWTFNDLWISDFLLDFMFLSSF